MSDLHVATLGHGPRVIFVHGSMGNGDSFSLQAPLAAEFTLEFPDRRGFGRTPARPTGVDFELDAFDILQLISSGQDRIAHLVGLSYGCLVCLYAAAIRPFAIRSMTLIEPPAFGLARGEPAVERLFERWSKMPPVTPQTRPEAWAVSFLRSLGYGVPDHPQFTDQNLSDFRSSMTERPPETADLDLKAIRDGLVATMVVRGDWSTAGKEAAAIGGAAFAETSSAVATRLGARLVVMSGAGHNLQAEAPERFNSLLAGFLRESEERDRRN